MAEIYKTFSKIYMETGDTMLNWKLWSEAYKLVPTLASACKDTIVENPKLVKMINDKEKIDAVVTLSNCGSFLSHIFDTQLIMFRGETVRLARFKSTNFLIFSVVQYFSFETGPFFDSHQERLH